MGAAMENINKAIDFSKSSNELFIKRGLIHYINKEYDLAFKDFNKALAYTKNSTAFLYKAACLLEQKRYEESLKESYNYLKYKRLNVDGFVYYLTGKAYEAEGKTVLSGQELAMAKRTGTRLIENDPLYEALFDITQLKLDSIQVDPGY